MGDRLVVEGQRHGVEHVVPVAILPLSVLPAIDPELRESPDERPDDLRLTRPAIVEQRSTHRLGGVGREREIVLVCQASQEPAERGKSWLRSQRAAWDVLEYEGVRAVGTYPALKGTSDGRESALRRHMAQHEDAGINEMGAQEHGVTEFAGTGVDGQDGRIMWAHGCNV